MSQDNYHENPDKLGEFTRNMHRAIRSLIEELEAVDAYNQRAVNCDDESLRSILVHNRDEEKEHAAMLLEWIRRHDTEFDAELKAYLFSKSSIAHE